MLSEYFQEVHVIARSTFKPEPINADRAKKNKKIKLHEGIEIKEIIGDQFVKSVILTGPINGKTNFPVDAIFVEVGHIPLSDLAIKLGVNTNKKGEIVITRNARTNIPGIYAAGDVADLQFKQAITGVGEAVTAIYSLYDDRERINKI